MINQTLKLQSIAFSYDHRQVVSDVSLTVNQGEIACLLGPSGCGKSTLLRLIAGFEQPDSGCIEINNHCVASAQQMTPPQQRNVGMLFQDLALFPHLSVAKNISFGLQNQSQQQQNQRVDDVLELCRLSEFKHRYPHQLSGGQRQRVALARAMAPKPQLILLDEPFSSVETGLQSELVHEVKQMLRADHSTALWVTHSLEEAFAVADQMGVMLSGQLLQWDTPTNLYQKPAHPDVVRFLNHANLVSGRISADGRLNTAIGSFDLSNKNKFAPQQQVQVAVNKNQLFINPKQTSNAVVSACVYQGGFYLITALLEDGNRIKFRNEFAIKSQQSICIEPFNNNQYNGFLITE